MLFFQVQFLAYVLVPQYCAPNAVASGEAAAKSWCFLDVSGFGYLARARSIYLWVLWSLGWLELGSLGRVEL
jgi:hypothetical protein